MELERKQHLFDGVRNHVHCVVDLLLAQCQPDLFEDFYVQCIPIISLLTYRVSCAVVMEVNKLGQVVLYDLSKQHTV